MATVSPTDREPGLGARDGAESRSEIRIRTMTRKDLHRVLAIERASFAVPWTMNTFRSLLERKGTGLWVAESDSEVVGYAVVWAVANQAELGNVAVADGWRRRGIAGRLVETVLEWLRERGVKHVFLEVRASNAGAQALYGRHGFEPVGRRPGYYSRPEEDALVLRRAV
ncbi:MAG: ribosomal protein S18-alanine N-acetyltransferase [Longimicrobiales bacterium]